MPRRIPHLGAWTYRYNPIGTLASRGDPKQQTTSYAYDSLDRVTANNGPGLAVPYTYDTGTVGIGRPATMTDAAGTATYGYDVRGRLASLVRTINGASYRFGIFYDDQDRVLSMGYPNGDLLAYRYGDHGRATDLLLNNATRLVRGATYSPLGAPWTLPLGNGLATVYRYFGPDVTPPQPNQWYGRLASIQTGASQSQQVTAYDAVGNPTGLSYGDHTAETFACTYNEWDQLTAYGGLETYTYTDGSEAHDIGTLRTLGDAGYGYPLAGQPRPHAADVVSTIGDYSYDAAGNRAGDVWYSYTYDAEQHMTQALQSGSPVLTNTYDGDGARLVRTVAGGATTHYVGEWYEYDPVAQVATAYYPFDGRPVAMEQGAALSYLHRDHPGSTVAATDAAGAELGSARYAPFGRLRLWGGSWPTDRRFLGGPRDRGVEFLNALGARYYDAYAGRFHAPDAALPDLAKGGPAASGVGYCRPASSSRRRRSAGISPMVKAAPEWGSSAMRGMWSGMVTPRKPASCSVRIPRYISWSPSSTTVTATCGRAPATVRRAPPCRPFVTARAAPSP